MIGLSQPSESFILRISFICIELSKTFDIVDTIFSYLRNCPPDGHLFPWYHINRTAEYKKSTECQALFRSALCCKHFSSLALKHLWWNQDSLQNILKLLPGYTFHRESATIVSFERVWSFRLCLNLTRIYNR